MAKLANDTMNALRAVAADIPTPHATRPTHASSVNIYNQVRTLIIQTMTNPIISRDTDLHSVQDLPGRREEDGPARPPPDRLQQLLASVPKVHRQRLHLPRGGGRAKATQEWKHENTLQPLTPPSI
jgi:hypothetical protein